MRTLALIAALVLTAHTFCWDRSIGASGYRVYWSSASDMWAAGSMSETAALCLADPVPDPVPGELIYFIVTAFNSHGESETEHGPIM